MTLSRCWSSVVRPPPSLARCQSCSSSCARWLIRSMIGSSAMAYSLTERYAAGRRSAGQEPGGLLGTQDMEHVVVDGVAEPVALLGVGRDRIGHLDRHVDRPDHDHVTPIVEERH